MPMPGIKSSVTRAGTISYIQGGYLALNNDHIQELIARAKEAHRSRARICCHESVDSLVHEMFIAHQFGDYIRPHKHRGKSESLLVVYGKIDYLMFSDDGELEACHPLGDAQSGLPFYLNLRTEKFHTIMIRSDWAVFFEVTQGPLKEGASIAAQWSPEQDQHVAVSKFVDRLEHEITCLR